MCSLESINGAGKLCKEASLPKCFVVLFFFNIFLEGQVEHLLMEQ